MSDILHRLFTTHVVFFIFFCIGLIELTIIALVVQFRKRLIAKGYDAKGTVVDVINSMGSKGGAVYKPVIKFKTYLNEEVQVTAKWGSNPNFYPIGSEMKIFYDPDKPSRFIIKEDKRLRVVLIIMSIVSGSFFLLGLEVSFPYYSNNNLKYLNRRSPDSYPDHDCNNQLCNHIKS